MYLNSKIPFEMYKSIVSDTYFVDKTALIEELIPSIGKEGRYFCITRPRRFGKSIMADMIGAFFERTVDSSALFCGLEIAEKEGYKEHLNQHDVIFIDLSEIPERCTSYTRYITRITDGLKADLCQIYPETARDTEKPVWDILTDIFQKEGKRFIFVLDEWDAIFHMPFITEEDKKAYLLFLKALLKGKVYVGLAYMTGVLPIAKYSSGSELNMFLEYDMATKKRFSSYFGFLDQEVDRLYAVYKEKNRAPEMTREDLREWYDGYHTAKGVRLYNPRSIICALTDDELASYWTSSGPYDEIFYYIRNDIEGIRDDLVLMIAGEGVRADIRNYAAVSMELDTKDEIYSAMVVYGLLTYEDGKVFIPNRELMDQFRKLLLSKASLGYVHTLAKESERMMRATLAGDTDTMAAILKYAHDTESPIFTYNSEIELSAVVNLVYLSARDVYRVEREDKGGEGYVDFIFYPERGEMDALLLELKIDGTPEDAIRQIRDRRYALRFKGKLGEKPRYTGRILAVGISYDRRTKEHFCKVEEIKACEGGL